MAPEIRVNGTLTASSRGWFNIDSEMHIRQIEKLAGLCVMVCDMVQIQDDPTENAASLASKLEAVFIEIEARAEWLREIAEIESYPTFKQAQAEQAT
ncbi:MAG TPA: hypothetical protein PLQ11_01635 [Beijerinckiaceae bacterium]|nr:hypothetical protein [Beijerinckiaceae bacterium]